MKKGRVDEQDEVSVADGMREWYLDDPMASFGVVIVKQCVGAGKPQILGLFHERTASCSLRFLTLAARYDIVHLYLARSAFRYHDLQTLSPVQKVRCDPVFAKARS